LHEERQTTCSANASAQSLAKAIMAFLKLERKSAAHDADILRLGHRLTAFERELLAVGVTELKT
jgi:hypothetical protein